tara:strand:+ start:1400 stop:1573 length:174 start_codon:yes stop_codon:yes gene_type:complete
VAETSTLFGKKTSSTCSLGESAAGPARIGTDEVEDAIVVVGIGNAEVDGTRVVANEG